MAANWFVNAGRKAVHLSRMGLELIRYRPLRAPVIAAKLAIARSILAIDAPSFMMLRMDEQPMRRWHDSMRYSAPVLRIINWQGDGRRLTVDKLMSAERLAEAGLPSAPLIAVIGRDGAAHPHGGRFPQWSGVEEIVRGLPSCPDELFVKPATGWRGEGIIGPERQHGGWAVSGETMSGHEFAEHLLKMAPPSGSLLQERIRSHRGLAPIGGDFGLGTIRIATALAAEGVEVLFAFGKIMAAKNLVDNFSEGTSGNMAAGIDKESGMITHVFGRKPGQRFLIEALTEHPATGTALIGFQMPLWNQTVALAKRVATAFPETPLIATDIAITDDGPLTIEVQSDWGSTAAQLVTGRGLRPLLRDVIPRLALSDAPKQQALAHIALSRRAQRRKLPLGKARSSAEAAAQDQLDAARAPRQ